MTERACGASAAIPPAMAGTSSRTGKLSAPTATAMALAAEPVAHTPTHPSSPSSAAIRARSPCAAPAGSPRCGSRRLHSSSSGTRFLPVPPLKAADDSDPAATATATTLTELAPASTPTVYFTLISSLVLCAEHGPKQRGRSKLASLPPAFLPPALFPPRPRRRLRAPPPTPRTRQETPRGPVS